MTARKALELGTIEGARSMGLDGIVGSLTPGKRADVIMVETRAVNMGGFLEDPSHLLIESALPEHVDTVVIDGRILKRNGRLTALDTKQAGQEARVALAGVRKRAAWR
jgi:5-methylthioadenosine/S-adenosylhomocysteine deaminase